MICGSIDVLRWIWTSIVSVLDRHQIDSCFVRSSHHRTVLTKSCTRNADRRAIDQTHEKFRMIDKCRNKFSANTLVIW